MKTVILMFLTVMMSSCAHKTIHQRCSDPDTVAQYRDYDQCYMEESARQDRKRRAFASIGDGFSNMGQRQQLNCTTTTSYGTASTHCY